MFKISYFFIYIFFIYIYFFLKGGVSKPPTHQKVTSSLLDFFSVDLTVVLKKKKKVKIKMRTTYNQITKVSTCPISGTALVTLTAYITDFISSIFDPDHDVFLNILSFNLLFLKTKQLS